MDNQTEQKLFALRGRRSRPTFVWHNDGGNLRVLTLIAPSALAVLLFIFAMPRPEFTAKPRNRRLSIG